MKEKRNDLELKAFCIKRGKPKQLQEQKRPQGGAGQGAAFWKGTSRKQLQKDSKVQTKQRGRRCPYLLPGLTATPKASPALHLGQEAIQARSGQAEGSPAREPGQQDGHRSSAVCRRGRCQACQPQRELSMHQAAPSRCPLQVTYSFRAREFPVALARGIQIDVFTLTSLLTGVFTLRETG